MMPKNIIVQVSNTTMKLMEVREVMKLKQTKNNIMTIEKWLADVHYDNLGTCIWNREKDGGNQMIADIRGWGAIQNEFKTNEEAEKFQDEVGEFIVQAIREKIASTSSKTEISDEEIKEAAKDYHWKNGVYYAQEKTFIDAIKWYREQIKSI